ncbi:hypothetical protein SARC_10815 [Sphaeroforma arctica JP610]|uniref:Uncharacterized protein n=1 Tax=Sphaeroforma arctica JP610 TaxID=667725 RepID=A0A0L0FIX2_9EUKA|nr:hypothetical protein SARC_10815 [Sphaeroforma arctica JP610]KNC76700.1 hypothetical protein SARC_10815 [Sphaeroforma arctica JP610]|eukprot:XP_014150602.1 hypothetical protein SARC_10815 [Sphaeroforma arctica JP610]
MEACTWPAPPSGEFSISPSLVDVFDNDEIDCQVMCKVGKGTCLRNVILQLSAEVVYPRRNGDVQMRIQVVSDELLLQADSMEAATDPHTFDASFVIPSRSPSTFETRHLFSIKCQGFIIHARVEWRVRLFGEVWSTIDSGEDPVVSLLAESELTKYSLYTKNSKPATVEGVSVAKVGKIFRKSHSSGKVGTDSPSASATSLLGSSTSTLNQRRNSRRSNMNSSEPCSDAEDSDYDSADSESLTPSFDSVTRETFANSLAGGDVQKSDLQFSYAQHGASDENDFELGKMQRDEDIEVDMLGALNTILSTDYDQPDIPENKECLMLRASLDETEAVSNRKPIKLTVSILNMSRFLRVRAIGVQLLQNVTYLLVGKRLGKTTMVSRQKIKNPSVARGVSTDFNFSINPSSGASYNSSQFFSFAGESLESEVPAATSHVIGPSGFLLIRVGYMLEIRCSVWGGNRIVMRIPVVMESGAPGYTTDPSPKAESSSLRLQSSQPTPQMATALTTASMSMRRSINMNALTHRRSSNLANGRGSPELPRTGSHNSCPSSPANRSRGRAATTPSTLRQVVDVNGSLIPPSDGTAAHPSCSNCEEADGGCGPDCEVNSDRSENDGSNRTKTSSRGLSNSASSSTNNMTAPGNSRLSNGGQRIGTLITQQSGSAISLPAQMPSPVPNVRRRTSLSHNVGTSGSESPMQSPGHGTRSPARCTSFDSWSMSLPQYDHIDSLSTKSFGNLQQHESPSASPRLRKDTSMRGSGSLAKRLTHRLANMSSMQRGSSTSKLTLESVKSLQTTIDQDARGSLQRSTSTASFDVDSDGHTTARRNTISELPDYNELFRGV